MALSVSSLASSLSSLSFSSQISRNPNSISIPQPPKTLPISFSSKTTRSLSIAATVAAPAEVEPVENLKKYVKSRLPGGFAAQTIIGTGRRKCAIARVVLQEGTGKFIINYRDAKEYLQGNPLWLQYIKVPLVTLGYETSYDVFVKAHGGGLSGQAQAISLGIARALLKVSADHRSPLKKEGLLTRDSRVVERKKVGLKKARKAPQFSKHKAIGESKGGNLMGEAGRLQAIPEGQVQWFANKGVLGPVFGRYFRLLLKTHNPDIVALVESRGDANAIWSSSKRLGAISLIRSGTLTHGKHKDATGKLFEMKYLDFDHIDRRKARFLARIQGIEMALETVSSPFLEDLEVDLKNELNLVPDQEESLWHKKSRSNWVVG
ncbi:hypothetical protein V6N12_037272 [Hibiscus sabdariffa]|uniref:30S ribosomal protein S9, chloroplastic n=2 Tax=Hibiscus sabdariffa TaxID=183260 RepID=A0ABR2C3D8_9ROSI